MQIQQNISLRQYNTMGIDAKARQFSIFGTLETLQELTTFSDDTNTAKLVLGGGSNILLTKDFDGLVLKNELPGIELIHETDTHYYVKAGAGENWHRFVQYSIGRGWAGLENLSLIPGNVGASPMQNIGAYGVELRDVFEELEAWHLKDKKIVTFTNNDCEFGYRESVFKRRFQHEFVILNVTYRLNKIPKFNTSYGAIEQELEKMDVKDLSIRAIADAVIRIRSSKLPDPAKIGNAGSFFKNPSVPAAQYEQLKLNFPGIVGYANPDGTVKLAAGWLIEQCGWKGFRRGDAGCHEQQALVLVNYGNATGAGIYELSTEIMDSVQSRFGVQLEREVNII
jgi:UDP-N-acetylmuramate dehydrogenase